jgi:hypothetical protein
MIKMLPCRHRAVVGPRPSMPTPHARPRNAGPIHRDDQRLRARHSRSGSGGPLLRSHYSAGTRLARSHHRAVVCRPVRPHLAALVAAMPTVVATRSPAEEHSGEEDHRDDEQHTGDDADPRQDPVEPSWPVLPVVVVRWWHTFGVPTVGAVEDSGVSVMFGASSVGRAG